MPVNYLSTSSCISGSVGGAVLPTRAEANQVTLSTRRSLDSVSRNGR